MKKKITDAALDFELNAKCGKHALVSGAYRAFTAKVHNMTPQDLPDTVYDRVWSKTMEETLARFNCKLVFKKHRNQFYNGHWGGKYYLSFESADDVTLFVLSAE